MQYKYLGSVKHMKPVVHMITNYVTANDCANLLLACGARPVMADSVEEAPEITQNSNALVINMGTLSTNVIPAMLASGRKANEIGIPVILDPVGVGSSSFRMHTALHLLSEIQFSVIRCNASELMALLFEKKCTNGVDAHGEDAITETNLKDFLTFGKQLSRKTKSILAMSGSVDIVTKDNRSCLIRNGVEMMSRVTGTGCQLSALIGAFSAVNPESLFEAVSAAMIVMGVSGEIAYERLSEIDGNMRFRNGIIDAIYRMTPMDLVRRANYEIE